MSSSVCLSLACSPIERSEAELDQRDGALGSPYQISPADCVCAGPQIPSNCTTISIREYGFGKRRMEHVGACGAAFWTRRDGAADQRLDQISSSIHSSFSALIHCPTYRLPSIVFETSSMARLLPSFSTGAHLSNKESLSGGSAVDCGHLCSLPIISVKNDMQ